MSGLKLYKITETHADGTVETPQEGSSTRVIDESVADQVKNAMESVAEG